MYSKSNWSRYRTKFPFLSRLATDCRSRFIVTSVNPTLTFRPFFSKFRKFQPVEFFELMRSTRFWGKLTANLPPMLQTAEEARLSLQLVNSWRTKLPNPRISFQYKRNVSLHFDIPLMQIFAHNDNELYRPPAAF
jgi:hypothetical protein